jgi:hypothetical protein
MPQVEIRVKSGPLWQNQESEGIKNVVGHSVGEHGSLPIYIIM